MIAAPFPFHSPVTQANHMGLRSRWQNLPRDARGGYLVVLGYLLALALVVFVGSLAILLFGCFLYVVLIQVLDLAYHLMRGPQRTQRIAPLILLLGCMVSQCGGSPLGAVNLHLIFLVYRAGGPEYVNQWGQQQMQQPYVKPDEGRSIKRDQLPLPIRTYLPGYVSVGDTIWSDLVRVRIELGGGFFHYGVLIYPREYAPQPTWWQCLLGWPPEVDIYHEGG